jgi:hypothetical protein
MELRQLVSPEQRREFAHNLVQTRIAKGAGFCETKSSLVGEAHLAFGRLYALYDAQSANPDEMMSGFVLHDLGTFPQSYPKPDLTHLPPESVIECGELWARAAGSARATRQAAWIVAGLMKVQAILLYPIFKPWNLSSAYRRDFDRTGEPIQWPYARTLDGGKIYVQAMVSQGEKLDRMVREAGQWGFEADAQLNRVVFESPYTICTRQVERAKRVDEVSRGDRAAA